MQIPSWLKPNQPASPSQAQTILWAWVAGIAALWLISPFPFLPTPGEVLSAVADLWQNDNLGDALVTSLTLNVEAILVATMLSLGLAYLSTIALFRPAVAAWGRLRFLSMIGLVFAFTMMTHSGHALKLSILVFVVSVFFTTGMADVIASIPQEQYDLAKTLRMGDWETLWEVVILGKADEAFVVLRQNAAMSWLTISFVESLERSEGGVGALLATQDKYFHMAAIMGVQLLVLGLGLMQDYAIGGLRKLCCPYADLTRKRK
jgi:NitT/TauT family transport system permease protein